MTQTTIRALEDLLRRVLRAPVPGLDVARSAHLAHRSWVRAEEGRARCRGALAVLLALSLLVLLLGWYVGQRSAG